MRRQLLVILAMTMAGVANAEGDIQAGQLKGETCLGCHGVASYKNAYPTYHVPRLGGQGEGYLIAAMRAYANEERTHRTMQGQAMSLSDEDIADIAAWFSSLADIQ